MLRTIPRCPPWVIGLRPNSDVSNNKSNSKSKNTFVRLNIVQLGPSPSSRTKLWFGPKMNTKVAFNTHHPPKTFETVQGKLEA